MPAVSLRRFTSLFARQHLWHATIVYVVTRVLIMMALVWGAKPPIDPRLFYGLDTAGFIIVVAVVLAALDRRRVGTPVLMANLGISVIESITLSAIPSVIGELAINVAVRA